VFEISSADTNTHLLFFLFFMMTLVHMPEAVTTIALYVIFIGFDALFVYSFVVFLGASYNIYNYMSLLCSGILLVYTIIVQLFVLSLYKKAVDHTVDLDGNSIERVIISTRTHYMLEILKQGGVCILAISLFQIGFTFPDPLGEYVCYCKASISDISKMDKYSMYACDVIAWFFIVTFFDKVF
jgi:hypothetical protein